MTMHSRAIIDFLVLMPVPDRVIIMVNTWDTKGLVTILQSINLNSSNENVPVSG